jgi:hypothetical protein
MGRTIAFLCLICLMGCGDQDKQIGPLNQMKRFQVALYTESGRELLFSSVVESLKQLGNVQVVNAAECFVDSTDTSPSLLITITGDQSKAEGSMHLFGEVAVQPNQCKIVSQIWETKDQRESLIYPVLENNGIVFKKKSSSTPLKDSAMPAVIARMIAEFAQQYRKDNPADVYPTFYVYKQVL